MGRGCADCEVAWRRPEVGLEAIDEGVEEGVSLAISDRVGEVVVVARTVGDAEVVDSEKASMRTSLGVWTAREAVEGSSVTHSVTVAIQAVALAAM